MEFVVPGWEIVKCIWRCIKDPPCSYDLPEVLPRLETKMKSLTAVYDGVMATVLLEEEHQRIRTGEVDDWIRRIETVKKEIADLVIDGEKEMENKCPGNCFPRNCLAIHKLERLVREKMEVVEKMRSEASSFRDLTQPRRPLAIKLPLAKTEGFDSLFEEVWKFLEDDHVRIIGIYGMGCVGKTTLLKMVNNEFLTTSLGFEIVIWAEVSQHRVEEIQELILQRLEIPDYKWKGKRKGERATEILRFLETKTFLLLLDDIWQGLDLFNVLGIPIVDCQSNSKVMFTTRSQNVCRRMEAQKIIRVQGLAREKAFTLLSTTVGGEAVLNAHPDILGFAAHIIQECRGLPLALNIIGTQMKSITDPNQWEQLLKFLRHCPSEIPGMKHDLFPSLAKSYDMLDDYTIKSCFLYCSMFASVKKISYNELIQLWMGEGFLDQYEEPHTKGEGIIDQLSLASLLEIDNFKTCVRMHPMIRAMALWSACEKGEKQNKYVVREHQKLIQPSQLTKWKEAQRIALWHCDIEANRTPPSFPFLETLFVSNNRMRSFASGFLGYMPVIRVLDLSMSKLIELPDEIGSLVSLRYLNFSYTNIKELPINLRNLVNLRFLILDKTNFLLSIPSTILSNLLSLQSLSIFPSKVSEGNCTQLLNELERLEQMSDISLQLTHHLPTEKLLNSEKLRRATRQLCLQGCANMKSMELSPSIQMLQMGNCPHLECVLVNLENDRSQGFMPHRVATKFGLYTLCHLCIYMCPKLVNLTWLIHTPHLQSLDVRDCDLMEAVIDDDMDTDSEIEQELVMFSRLTTLKIYNLPNLQSICRQGLSFPSLTRISVKFCPSLRKLPLDSKTSTKMSLQEINGEQQWWDALIWEDDNINRILSPYFVPCDNQSPSAYATQGAGGSTSTIPISGI